MPTNDDSFVITAAMLTFAYTKPATVYSPGGAAVAGKTNSTDAYLPKLLTERAGCPGGTGSAVPSEANYVFAISGEGPAVDTNPTVSVPTVI
jgi:hypothetical protein